MGRSSKRDRKKGGGGKPDGGGGTSESKSDALQELTKVLLAQLEEIRARKAAKPDGQENPGRLELPDEWLHYVMGQLEECEIQDDDESVRKLKELYNEPNVAGRTCKTPGLPIGILRHAVYSHTLPL